MKKLYDKYTIYEYSDKGIVEEICKRVRSLRLSCCFSQQEFADKAGVSLVTIKRIESCKVNDIALSTLLKILRISGPLKGLPIWYRNFLILLSLSMKKQVREYNDLAVNARRYEERANHSECISMGNLHR